MNGLRALLPVDWVKMGGLERCQSFVIEIREVDVCIV